MCSIGDEWDICLFSLFSPWKIVDYSGCGKSRQTIIWHKVRFLWKQHKYVYINTLESNNEPMSLCRGMHADHGRALLCFARKLAEIKHAVECTALFTIFYSVELYRHPFRMTRILPNTRIGNQTVDSW